MCNPNVRDVLDIMHREQDMFRVLRCELSEVAPNQLVPKKLSLIAKHVRF